MDLKIDISTYLLTIVTLLIGWVLNLLSMRFTFKRTREIEKRKLLQTKIEELANLIDEMVRSYRKLWGEIAVSVSAGRQISVEGINPPFTKIQILIEFYFPQLRQDYQTLIKETGDFGRNIFPTLNEQDKIKRGQLFGDLTVNHERINKACERIAQLSANIARNLI